MVDRPIIFSGPMVRALLAGRKTQTRRLATSPLRRCEVGDRLYVRESYTVAGIFSDVVEVRYRAHERASHTEHVEQIPLARAHPKAVTFPLYTPSIHMPRWASRLTLIVEAVRVEPLQMISEADAIAEGVERGEHPITGDVDGWHDYSIIHAGPHKGKKHPHAVAPWKSAALSYQSLWETLHGVESWASNPDVLVLTFRVERVNIDQLPPP